MVKAAGQLVSTVEGLELVFAGRYVESHQESSFKATIDQLARDYRVRCRFLNHVPRDAMPYWYEQARVVVVPSWYEGLSIAALEGMAAGRPVVCTEKVAAAALLRDTGAGAVVPAGDPATLAQALLPYLRDPDAAAEAGRKAREVVAVYSQPDTVAVAYERAYSEAIDLWHHRPIFEPIPRRWKGKKISEASP